MTMDLDPPSQQLERCLVLLLSMCQVASHTLLQVVPSSYQELMVGVEESLYSSPLPFPRCVFYWSLCLHSDYFTYCMSFRSCVIVLYMHQMKQYCIHYICWRCLHLSLAVLTNAIRRSLTIFYMFSMLLKGLVISIYIIIIRRAHLTSLTFLMFPLLGKYQVILLHW